MSRNRETNRVKVKEAKKEEQLNAKNEWGLNDPTPKSAVANIIRKEK